jgi:predicted acetyltransferase
MPEQRSQCFRAGRSEEIAAVAELMNHSFPAPGRGVSWWRSYLVSGPHGGSEDIWVAEDGGHLVGACLLLRMRQWISGVALPIAGVGAVSIALSHRRVGLAERMLRAGLAHARARGDIASALYPFRVSYYQGLGYGVAGEAHQYRVPPRSFPDDADARRRIHLVRGSDDRRDLERVYELGARTGSGQIERTERSWDEVVDGDDRAAVLYRNSGGEPQGYAVVRYRTDLPPAQRFLEVEERMWLTDEARRAVYAWISSVGDQWREVVYRAHPAERLGDVLAEPRLPVGAAPGWNLWFPSATLLLGPMFRLLNVPAALAARSFVDGADGVTLRLVVEDGQILENAGPWSLRLGGGRAAVEPDGADGADSGAADGTLTLPVSVLSRMYIGAITPSDAVASGAARLDAPELLPALDDAFRVPEPWTFERF